MSERTEKIADQLFEEVEVRAQTLSLREYVDLLGDLAALLEVAIEAGKEDLRREEFLEECREER